MSRSIDTDVRIGVFHPGTQHSHETALAFQEAGSLAWYATSIFYDPQRWPYNAVKFLPSGARGRLEYEFKRRYHPGIDPSLVRTFGVWEWVERLSMRAGFRMLEHYANEWGNVRFGRQVADLAARTSVDAIWGSDTSSLTAFRGVKDRGVRCVLEQTIGHPRVWNRILTEERSLVGPDFDPYPLPYPEADMQRVEREMELADGIVCGSAFVRDTLIENGVKAEKTCVIPYGVPEETFSPRETSAERDGLRLLFVGHFGLRKGAWYLLEAMRRLADLRGLTLTIVGKETVPDRFLAPFGDRIRRLPHVPRNQVCKVYQDADVFVLPSLFEGSAISVFEALASGLPVVTTPNAGSVVRDGVDGFVVPIRDADALADRIATLYKDRRRRADMAVQARARALEFPWRRYRQELVRWLNSRAN
jgi:glycosyltransferase involved in cell wall biosynthesis